MITILGTGHVFDLRGRIQDEIFRRNPAVVALELDPPRFQALERPNDPKAKAPLVYRLLGSFQTRVAREYGVEAGDEMRAAAQAARDIRARLALIDRDAQQTFQRLFREMPFREKMRLLVDAVGGLLLPGKSVDEQVREMENDYAAVFREIGKRFPTLKRVVLDERNEHMANAIHAIAAQHPDLVAVMGDGHVDGVVAILKDRGIEVETVRLKDLRAASKPAEGGTASATVTFEAEG